MTDFAEYLTIIPMSQVKAIRRAINVLMRAGVSRDNALNVIVSAHMRRMESYDNNRAVTAITARAK
jgi:hypothetical protein